jgi:hypothetical protein
MTLTSFATLQADHIYRTGPEMLIAQSSTILAGPVSNYSQEVRSRSEGGPDSIPLAWEVSGQLKSPRVLKGQAPSGAIPFSRSERSIFLPKDRAIPDWEAVYGELASNDRVVLFLGDTSPESILKVIPSGHGERDLIALVQDIVPIQANDNAEERRRQWLLYLDHAQHDEGRKAALRALIHAPGEWTDIEPVLERLMVNPQVSRKMRAFGFGIVAFALTGGHWETSQSQTGSFLCRQFSVEQDQNLLLSFILSIKQVLRHNYDEMSRSMINPVGLQFLDCLKRRESLGHFEPAIEGQYQEIHASYPDYWEQK